jgi:hypothetical protein
LWLDCQPAEHFIGAAVYTQLCHILALVSGWRNSFINVLKNGRGGKFRLAFSDWPRYKEKVHQERRSRDGKSRGR